MRNRALIVVLWRGGLRVSEATALMVRNIDLANGTLRVLHGKGDKARTVGLDPQACAMLELWLARRRQLGIAHSVPLFCTISRDEKTHGRRHRAIKPPYVRNLLKRLATKAGVDRRVHPHGLRHTYAYELAMEGLPLLTISTLLGHNNVATTDRYVRHLAPIHAIEAMHARVWPVDQGHRAA